MLLSGMGEQTGGELVGEVPEGLVDLGLELGEGSGVTGQLFGPGLLVGSELLLDLFEGQGGFGDIGPGLGVETAAHGRSFRVKALLPR